MSTAEKLGSNWKKSTKKLYRIQQIMFDGERMRFFQSKAWENEDGRKKCFTSAELLWSEGMAICK